MTLRAVVLVLVAVLFFVLPSTTRFATDWLWFGELGYRDVFLTALYGRFGIGLAVFVLAFVWFAAHLRHAMRAASGAPASFTTREGFTIVLPTRDQLRPLALLAAAAAALLLAAVAGSEWLTVLAWWHATPFPGEDPILGHNAAFYVFTMPVMELVRGIGLALVVLAALGSAALYVVAGELALTPFGIRMAPGVRRHAAVLAAAFFAILALGAWLDQPRQLLSPSGIIQGASYADVHARMPAALALAVATLAGVALSLVHAMGRARWALLAAAGLYAVVLLGGMAYSTFLQRLIVAPNEQAREAPYITHNIAATRQGFALDRVAERELTGDAELTRVDIEKNRETLDNVRLWDQQPLLETFGQIQEIRTYYDFMSVDNDRYDIGGRRRQVMLSVRELNPAALPNRTWINERLVFTHGHGLTLGPVNQVTPEGLPVLFIRDLPPVSTVDLNVSQPGIYYGELSNDYVIAPTRAREFHYPEGEDNVYTDYAGNGGVPLSSFFRKLLFAAHFRAYQILLSNDISTESRVLYERQIRARVSKIAPFLVYDDDPYPVIVDGRVFWIQDAYTTSSRYPYSTSTAGNINYIRNAVKVVVDAYNGAVTFYLAEPDDPIVQTLTRIFPTLLRPISEMPPGLRQHVRYPEGIFNLQASMYSTYHMTNPGVFYNKEDQGEVPAIDRGGETVRMQPYYTIMKLPGEQAAEFIQMLPFTPRRRDNLASWLVARSDGDRYGQLIVFQFPKQKLVFGPRQVVARINQDQVIAPQITLWNQQGSEVIQGTLMVIPVEESLIYIRPLYLRAQAGRIPELTRVIVAYQNQIVMERTLEAGLARIFGLPLPAGEAIAADPATATATPGAPDTRAAGVAPSVPGSPGAPDLAAEAHAIYERAIAAQKAGDWARYGEEIKRLGETLDRLRRRQ
ncbi:MAG: UPF0182 family membrane protein [Acidobacteriota bacterium]